MEITRRPNEATTIVFPMIETLNPEDYLTGLTVADEGFYNDSGSWVSLPITDTVSEVGSSGLYSIDLTAAEINHVMVAIKFTAATAADQGVLIYTDESSLAVRNMVVESQGSITFQQAMSVMLAVLAGESSNSGLTFQDSAGVSNRVVSNVDSNSNRTTITLYPSS